eukprot:m.191346 g.191346  ORF g.191346 m.191346 type:complete len:435 (+) comp14839_c0_seq1:1182-2486(+)
MFGVLYATLMSLLKFVGVPLQTSQLDPTDPKQGETRTAYDNPMPVSAPWGLQRYFTNLSNEPMHIVIGFLALATLLVFFIARIWPQVVHALSTMLRERLDGGALHRHARHDVDRYRDTTSRGLTNEFKGVADAEVQYLCALVHRLEVGASTEAVQADSKDYCKGDQQTQAEGCCTATVYGTKSSECRIFVIPHRWVWFEEQLSERAAPVPIKEPNGDTAEGTEASAHEANWFDFALDYEAKVDVDEAARTKEEKGNHYKEGLEEFSTTAGDAAVSGEGGTTNMSFMATSQLMRCTSTSTCMSVDEMVTLLIPLHASESDFPRSELCTAAVAVVQRWKRVSESHACHSYAELSRYLLKPNEPQQQAQQYTLHAVQKVYNAGAQGKECAVCWDAPIEVLLVPCMHAALCHACASSANLTRCPMCQKQPTQMIVFAQ